MAKEKSTAKNNGANLGFEAELWKMADSLRNNMDAAEYVYPPDLQERATNTALEQAEPLSAEWAVAP